MCRSGSPVTILESMDSKHFPSMTGEYVKERTFALSFARAFSRLSEKQRGNSHEVKLLRKALRFSESDSLRHSEKSSTSFSTSCALFCKTMGVGVAGLESCTLYSCTLSLLHYLLRSQNVAIENELNTMESNSSINLPGRGVPK